jgi:hypothetical protein
MASRSAVLDEVSLSGVGAVAVHAIYGQRDVVAEGMLLGVLALMVAIYLYIFFRVRTGPLRRWMGWVQATLEMGTVGAIMLTDLKFTGATYAFTSAATTITFFAVMLTSLRLMPWLSIYSAVFGTAMHLAIYAYAYPSFTDLATNQAVQLPNEILRCVVILLTGLLSALLAKSLRAAMSGGIRSVRERVRTAFGRFVELSIGIGIQRGPQGSRRVSRPLSGEAVELVLGRNFEQEARKLGLT